ncbi:hypothetical protein BDU57DRAFT_355728 [Ampelomyces quisqualis]|uniref:Uncharacterized protein n=1 Tax=Ampelomyces quisqualis TaxID=50730 RepID=A0A6A5QCU9_AMPQU|nr:hypothetical protein BDU57DRAFT_355728 [Ampelomyces quisqualis]
MASHPKPPAQLFRTLKLLASTPKTATYLCLPRTLDAPSSPVPRGAHTSLRTQHSAFVPQLKCVTTSSSPASLRAACDVLEKLGRRIVRVQFTAEAESSWVCSAPVFGASLADVGGRAGREDGGVPGYFLAHVFIGVLDAVQEGGGLAGEITAENVLVDPHGDDDGIWRWRGWPEIVVMGLGSVDAGDGEEVKKTARSVLELMSRGIGEWSDSAPVFGAEAKQRAMVTDDRILLVLADVQELLRGEGGEAGMEEVRAKVFGRLTDIRQAGPAHLPRFLAEKVHSDLVTDDEMRRALREPTVLTFKNRHAAFVRIIADEPVDMGSGGHAGMKTSRILVIRFTSRKEAFSRMRGVDPEWRGDGVDGLLEEDEDYVMEDAC